jgi:hypothetical protein
MIRLHLTCSACPEQYDAFNDSGVQVGYLRLRHGRFTVEAPDSGGLLLYQAHPQGDGIFLNSERHHFLQIACHAIKHWIKTGEALNVLDEAKPLYTVDNPDHYL